MYTRLVVTSLVAGLVVGCATVDDASAQDDRGDPATGTGSHAASTADEAAEDTGASTGGPSGPPNTGTDTGTDTGTGTGTSPNDNGEPKPDIGAGPEPMLPWGDPVDCENHRATAESSIALSGLMDGVEESFECDFTGQLDYVHYCEGVAVGFLALCITSDGTRISMQLAPAMEGEYSETVGEPRFAFDIIDGETTYSATVNNAVQHLLVVEELELELDARRVRGTFELAWYDLEIGGLHHPDGRVTGTFDIAF